MCMVGAEVFRVTLLFKTKVPAGCCCVPTSLTAGTFGRETSTYTVKPEELNHPVLSALLWV